MADPLSVNGATGGIDATKWKKLTPQEIIKEQSKGEEVPAEIVAWAQQVAAFSQIPDDVTYEEVDGDTGIDALEKLGLSMEEATDPQVENAEKPTDTEDPDAVKDPARVGDVDEENPNETPAEDGIVPPPPGQVGDAPKPEDEDKPEDLTLADSSITTDDEEIRRRKARKGLP